MGKIMEMAAEWWIKWGFGIMGGGILGGLKYLRGRQRKTEARQRALEEGMVAILRDRIIWAYYHYHDRGSITLQGLENVKGMYAAYKALGGNGIVDKLEDDMLELEVEG